MKKSLGMIVLTLLMIGAASCAPSVRHMDGADRTITMGVFAEVADEAAAEPGQVDLVFRLSIKTHMTGFYLLESPGSLHGKPGYPFIVTIDGQTVVWRAEGTLEETPVYDENGVRTAEGGDGVRYILDKRVRLAPGRHRVEFELPEESYACAVNVVLAEKDGPHVLELKPVYRRSGSQRPAFLHGLSRLEPSLDGNPVRTGS